MEKTAEFSKKIIAEIASILKMPVVELERESLRVYLQNRLAQVQVSLDELKNRYHVTTSEQMENLYREGKLGEENSWQDFFRFDHLEDERESLCRALDVILRESLVTKIISRSN